MTSRNLKSIIFRGEVIEDYFVDDLGLIYSTKRGSLALLSVQRGDDWNPYPKVTIKVDGARKTVSVHRLVCETFHKKPLINILTEKEWNSIDKVIRDKLLEHIQHADRYQVNHIDHDRNNFHPSNLEWVTASENQQKFQEHRKAA